MEWVQFGTLWPGNRDGESSRYKPFDVQQKIAWEGMSPRCFSMKWGVAWAGRAEMTRVAPSRASGTFAVACRPSGSSMSDK